MMLTRFFIATCLVGHAVALNLAPLGTMRMAKRGRSSVVRMDDIPMSKPADANVVVSDREPFTCSNKHP